MCSSLSLVAVICLLLGQTPVARATGGEPEIVPAPVSRRPKTTRAADRNDLPPELTIAEVTRRYRILGLPEARLGKFLRSGKSLTAFYNEARFGGEGLKVGGTILVILGAVSVVFGAVYTHFLLREVCRSDECDDGGAPAMLAGLIGFPAMLAGGLEIAAGVPMLVVGMLRMRRWRAEGELETAPIEALENLRERSAPKPKSTVSVLPYLTRGGGGLSLALRF